MRPNLTFAGPPLCYDRGGAGRGLPRAQVALAWLLRKPDITAPIIGITKAHHLTDALAALDVDLSDEEVAQLEAPYIPHPVVGSF